MVNKGCPFSAHISWPCTYFAWLAENMWDDIYWIIGSVVKGLPLFVYIWDDHAYIFHDLLETRRWDKMDWILSLMVNKGYDHAYIFMIGWKHVGEIRWTEFLV